MTLTLKGMDITGGLILLAIVVAAITVGLWAKYHPADARRDEETGISEREWSDAIR